MLTSNDISDIVSSRLWIARDLIRMLEFSFALLTVTVGLAIIIDLLWYKLIPEVYHKRDRNSVMCVR